MAQLKDLATKDFFLSDANFVDLFNAYCFDGKQVLKAENCRPMDSEMDNTDLSLRRNVDVVRKYIDGDIYAALILENQSYIDYTMVIRAAHYEYFQYEKMIRQEGYRKTTKLPMVHLLVFYTGEKEWDGAKKLSDMVKVNEKMKDYFHEYQMNLIEIASDRIYNFHEKDMRDLFYFTRYVYSKKIHEDKGLLEKFRHMTKKAARTAVILTDIDWIKWEDLEGEGEIDMCEAEREWKQKMMNEGIQQGIHQGMTTGASNKEREMYQTMLKNGLSLEQISQYCSVSLESIKTILN